MQIKKIKNFNNNQDTRYNNQTNSKFQCPSNLVIGYWILFVSCFLVFGYLFLFGCAQKAQIPLELVKNATEETYKDANAVILFDTTKVALNKDGSAVYTSHTLVKILSTYGKKEYGEQVFPYNKNISGVEIKFARVITPEGKIIPVPKESIKDLPFAPMDIQGSKLYLPDIRMLNVIFPKLETGASIEWLVVTKLKRAIMKDRFTEAVSFEDMEPIINKVYSLECPSTLKINYIVKNGDVSFVKTQKAEKTVYQWSAQNIARVIPEPLMPPISEVATMLIISNIPDWQEVSKWYYKESEPSFVADSLIKVKVHELTDTLATEEQKIKTLFNFVSMEIRYLRTEMISKEKGIEPAPAPLTFERKWGVCRDKAALLCTMLKEIGVAAYLVLIDVNRYTIKEVPTYLFEHGIVAIKNPDGSYYFLDPTMEYTREYFPIVEQNRDVLICTPEGDSLRFVPYENPGGDKIVLKEEAKLDANGNISGEQTLIGEGVLDYALRSFRYVPPDQLKQLFEQIVKQISPSATLDSLEISDAENLSLPFTIKLLYNAPEYAIKKDNELHLAQSESQGLFGGALGGGSPWGLEERKYPLFFQFPMLTQSSKTIELPKGYKVKKLPDDFLFENEYMKITLSKKVNKGKLIEQGETFIKEPLVPADKYKVLKKVMEDVEEYNKHKIILVKR